MTRVYCGHQVPAMTRVKGERWRGEAGLLRALSARNDEGKRGEVARGGGVIAGTQCPQ